jgi:hypothetical protein
VTTISITIPSPPSRRPCRGLRLSKAASRSAGSSALQAAATSKTLAIAMLFALVAAVFWPLYAFGDSTPAEPAWRLTVARDQIDAAIAALRTSFARADRERHVSPSRPSQRLKAQLGLTMALEGLHPAPFALPDLPDHRQAALGSHRTERVADWVHKGTGLPS